MIKYVCDSVSTVNYYFFRQNLINYLLFIPWFKLISFSIFLLINNLSYMTLIFSLLSLCVSIIFS